ncbi:spermidine/putrescine ABC transporter permease [Cellulomonas soli]|uniref:Spermidine/putrescine ABC transporter permease n=2 Tax=Cellulomonas soli TaxID=931535 RepID=A0A512PHD8_9CELL|nr:spermidine/putrescine ABC transporter permease [Cellulomonas soli]
MALGLAFVYVPLGVVLINSFNASTVFAWPPQELTTHWWTATIGNEGVRAAVLTSFEVGLVATTAALLLGTLLAFALGRYTFFGRHTLSLLVVLPIALPGIVTALAFRTGFRTFLGLELSIWTVAIAHATFCIVVVYNNALARLRRMGTTPEEASMDLGADTFTTFRLVTFPLLRGALVAGALLAFGLSFDEIVVTLFTAPPGVTTLPIWIYQNLSRPNQGPVVNVVAAVLVLASILPIYLSQKLSGESTGGGRL